MTIEDILAKSTACISQLFLRARLFLNSLHVRGKKGSGQTRIKEFVYGSWWLVEFKCVCFVRKLLVLGLANVLVLSEFMYDLACAFARIVFKSHSVSSLALYFSAQT